MEKSKFTAEQQATIVDTFGIFCDIADSKKGEYIPVFQSACILPADLLENIITRFNHKTKERKDG